jgi:N-acetylglucosaminyldiphosphoundecaprenol N-acetyl-beta-D-mannosaminyltransferase
MLMQERTACPHGHASSLGESSLVNGVRIDAVSSARFAIYIASFVDCGHSHVVHFIPADPTVVATRDPRYRATLNSGDLNVADGMSVVWALRLAGLNTERLTGSDALAILAIRYADRKPNHYFYGGTPSTLDRLQEKLRLTRPSISVVGESPPFRPLTDDDLREAADRIRASDADLLWIGLGTPKQDLVAERLRELGAAPVILCVGAAFDFWAGTKSRAPLWMQRIGLEWVHRLLSEPKRLWRRYLLENPRFILAVGAEHMRTRRHRFAGARLRTNQTESKLLQRRQSGQIPLRLRRRLACPPSRFRTRTPHDADKRSG